VRKKRVSGVETRLLNLAIRPGTEEMCAHASALQGGDVPKAAPNFVLLSEGEHANSTT
jgi:hypothetical protein